MIKKLPILLMLLGLFLLKGYQSKAQCTASRGVLDDFSTTSSTLSGIHTAGTPRTLVSQIQVF